MLHKLAHLLGLNGCMIIDFPDGGWVTCLGCGKRSFQVTSRTPEEYELLKEYGVGRGLATIDQGGK